MLMKKQITTKKYKKWAVPLFLVFLTFLLAASVCYLFDHDQKLWKQQQELLYFMAGSNNPDILKMAGEVLKGEITEENRKELTEQGKKIMESYGYTKNYQTDLKKKLSGFQNRAAVFFLLLWLSAGTGFLLFQYAGKRKYEEKLARVNQVLEEFRNHKFSEEGIKEAPGEEGKLYFNLRLLGNQLELTEERTKREKEETKSLVTDISHQLKTPVAALKTCLSVLLEEEMTKEERKEFLSRCLHQLSGLEELVLALIQISRLEAGIIAIHKEEASLFYTMLAAVNSIYPKAAGKGISIEMEEGSETFALLAEHDVRWTKEAFLNVLDNAVKYSAEKTVIKIRMLKRAEFVRIEIEDEGTGIPKDEYPKIFQRFYRGKTEVVKKSEGTGVGLYLTRQILERQGGSIMVTSLTKKEKHGTTFVIQMPGSLTKL